MGLDLVKKGAVKGGDMESWAVFEERTATHFSGELRFNGV